MRIAILTSGGDCPGLNTAIRAVVRAAIHRHGYDCFGILNGWKGLADGDIIPLPPGSVSGILTRGGTILGTSRFNPVKDDATVQKILSNLDRYKIDAVICIGGDGSLRAAHELAAHGVKIVGLPKTIDNDVFGTDITFGFHTAVQTVTEAIDRLHATAESLHRIMVVETMGRQAGWIAVTAGIAGGADMILIPERPFNYDQICRKLRQRHEIKSFSIVVVAEGASAEGGDIVTTGEVDSFGRPRLGGISYEVAHEIEKRNGIETRVTVLGHVQRSGTPTAYDRILATEFGLHAIEAVAANRFDHFVALRGTDYLPIPLAELIAQNKQVPDSLYETAELFFG